MNFRARFFTFSNASASRDRMECLNSIFKAWPDKIMCKKERLRTVKDSSATRRLVRVERLGRKLCCHEVSKENWCQVGKHLPLSCKHFANNKRKTDSPE